MKPTIALMTFVMVSLLAIGQAVAGMVDIGMGQMTQAEFDALKATVEGHAEANRPTVATPRPDTERYGMVEMTPADYESLRDKVAGNDTGSGAGPVTPQTRMVDIGMGEMPQAEFASLKQMVEGIQLAAAQP
jgi:hypothetical protein